MAARPHEAGRGRRDAGAGRPPFALRRRQFTTFVLATAIIVLCLAPSHAARDCQYFNAGRSWAEWLEGANPRGAKLVLGGEWHEMGTPHGQWIGYEPVTDTRVRGWLMVGLPPFMDPSNTERLKADLDIREKGEVETALHPQIIELAIGMVRGLVQRLDLLAVTELEPITIAGLEGRSRIVARTTEHHTSYATAIAVGDGCFFIFGLFSTNDGSRLSPADLAFLNNAITLE